ncbi:MAG: hypothetical protein HFJ54_02665 [Clostridia bacterium]|nr:hypothetical protein [Clostridia bacterium]
MKQLIRIEVSTPKFFIISSATAVEALPDIGRTKTRGRISDGIFKKLSIGLSKLVRRSRIPEDLNAEIARNNAISVGKIFVTVFIPSLQPTKKLSNTFTFSENA